MSTGLRALSRREWGKAAVVGIATGALLALLNIIALKAHLSPLPKPLGLAFAETMTGRQLPLPVGLLFHLVWVTFWSIVYLVLWRDDLTLKNAAVLAAALWLLAAVVFLPLVGWGVFGAAISLKLMLPLTVSHFGFAVILWGFTRVLFGPGVRPEQSQRMRA
jgi:hypothetical protein